jgi:hypothetical protein
MNIPGRLRTQDQTAVVGLAGKVLAHVGQTELAAEYATAADGVVLRGAAGLRAARPLFGSASVVVDPERYLDDRGRNRQLDLFAEAPEQAVEVQLAARVSVLLAPSRFPIDRTPDDIRTLLAVGSAFVDAQAHRRPPGLGRQTAHVARRPSSTYCAWWRAHLPGRPRQRSAAPPATR